MPANSPPQAGTKSSLPMEADSSMGWDQQGPDRSCHHDSGGKTKKCLLNFCPQRVFQKEYTGCTQSGTKKRYHKTEKYCHATLLLSAVDKTADSLVLNRCRFHKMVPAVLL